MPRGHNRPQLSIKCNSMQVFDCYISRLSITRIYAIEQDMSSKSGQRTSSTRRFSSMLAWPALAAALLTFANVAAADSAQNNREIRIELNKLEPTEGACRAYLLFENRSGASFESLKLDLVLFDGEGVVARRLAVEAAPLPEGKTSLKVFKIAKLPCDAIGRLLLNKFTSCGDAAGQRDDCLALTSTTARGAVPFIK